MELGLGRSKERLLQPELEGYLSIWVVVSVTAVSVVERDGTVGWLVVELGRVG